MINLTQITRLEIIDESGRVFGRYDLDGVKLSGQDEGRTLKVVLDYEGENLGNTATVIAAALHLLRSEDGNKALAIEWLDEHLDELIELAEGRYENDLSNS